MMEYFVLDCSVTMAWCFADEATKEVNGLLDALTEERQAYVPAVWPLEVLNVLLVGERKNRIHPKDSWEFLSLLLTLPIVQDPDLTPSILSRILDFGRDHQISAYDASYIELAMRRDIPIATLDHEVRAVAETLAIPCLL